MCVLDDDEQKEGEGDIEVSNYVNDVYTATISDVTFAAEEEKLYSHQFELDMICMILNT